MGKRGVAPRCMGIPPSFNEVRRRKPYDFLTQGVPIFVRRCRPAGDVALMHNRAQANSSRDELVPLVGVLAFVGGPLNGTRQAWIVCADPIRVYRCGDDATLAAGRGEVQPGDLGIYRVARQFTEDDEWIVELRWIGR